MSDFKPVNQPVTPASADPGEEFPFLHTITVVDRVVSVDKPELVQNNIKTETVTLNLDSEWEGLSTVINIGNEKPVSVIWSGEPVVIPAELMTTVGSLDVSVVGYGDDGGIRAVTKKATSIFNVVASGFVEGDEAVPDPTTILGQLTEAADRANQAAQNAEDSTIDKVNVTMLPTGSSASGSVADKTLSLRIPNGPEGPKGDPGDLTTVAHDDTLTGDGTRGNVLRQAERSCLRPRRVSSLGELAELGFYEVLHDSTDVPVENHRGTLFVSRLVGSDVAGQLFFSIFDSGTLRPRIFARAASSVDVGVGIQWSDWVEFVKTDDLSNYVPLSTYQALEVKVQALEAKTKVTKITADGTDLHTLLGKTGTYVKLWGTSVVNSPTAEFDSANSEYAITVVSAAGDGYMRIDSMAGTMNYSYYCAKNSSGISKWYKIQATPVS